MIVHVSDSQIVGETDGTLFTAVQQSLVSMGITLKNSGANTINYRFQKLNQDGTWSNMAELSPANDLNSTLVSGQEKLVVVSGNFFQCKLLGNASGGAQLDFSITRQVTRASQGPIPILNL